MADSTVLSLLDIDEYIQKNNLKEVKNANVWAPGKNSFDEEGLWSEAIFGRIGSKERRSTFGYIQLNEFLVNPVVYKMMRNSSEEIRDILTEKKSFIFNKKEGIFEESEAGETGLSFFCQHKDNIDFEKIAKKNKKDVGKFLNKNRTKIFIDKYLVIPAGGIRDMSTQKKEAKQFSSEINIFYEKLISLNSQLKMHMSEGEIKTIFMNQIQKVLIQCFTWIQNRMTGKGGIMRGTLLKKTVDYSARIVATSSPEIPLGSIGLPWHTILTLYEPFFMHYVLEKDHELSEMIKTNLSVNHNKPLSYHDIKTFNQQIAKSPDSVDGALKAKLMEVSAKITENKDILVKRDPVVSRKSYYSASIIPVESGRGAVVNALTCGPQGLDFDGDTVALLPIFTDEGLEEVSKLNPTKSKSMWTDTNKNKTIYGLSLDQVSTVFAMTKE